jgi:hypothetical protein
MSSNTNVLSISNAAVATRCTQCGAQPRLVQSMLDARKGLTLRVYKCPCGEQLWTTSSE